MEDLSANPSAAHGDVLYHAADGIATITINRPRKLNALSAVATQLLFEAWKRFENDATSRVAIFTASGDRAFCVGRDLDEPVDGNFRLDSFPILGVSVHVSKPTIAAVNGYALGGGFLLAQMCDLCIAADTATFSVPEARLGRGAAWATSLLGMLPMRVAMELLITAEPITAQRLYEVGFLNSVIPGPQLQSTARALAGTIAGNAPLSVRACRQMARTVALDGQKLSSDDAEAMFADVYASADAREGLAAFRERRAPKWIGA